MEGRGSLQSTGQEEMKACSDCVTLHYGEQSFEFPVLLNGRYKIMKNFDKGGFCTINECYDANT